MPAQDQIIDAVMALALQADAIRTHPLMAWIVMHDEATWPGAFVARLGQPPTCCCATRWRGCATSFLRD